MKALSIRNPYAHEILCGEKEIEYRTWQTKHRGDLLICSSKLPKIKNTISGHALCVANLSDCVRITADNYSEYGVSRSDADETLYAWLLDDVRVIKPFAVKGKLHLFDVDDELIEIIDDNSGEMTEEEADALFEQYIKPLLYTGESRPVKRRKTKSELEFEQMAEEAAQIARKMNE